MNKVLELKPSIISIIRVILSISEQKNADVLIG